MILIEDVEQTDNHQDEPAENDEYQAKQDAEEEKAEASNDQGVVESNDTTAYDNHTNDGISADDISFDASSLINVDVDPF